jgi:hypothetical protein
MSEEAINLYGRLEYAREINRFNYELGQ